MNNDKINDQENIEEDPKDVDYIKAISDLKKNSVAREEYNRVIEENKNLLKTLVEGGQIEEPKDDPPDISELRKKLFSDEDLNNYEYIDTALQLRDALIANGERDPFLPVGDQVEVTADMIQGAQDTADALREMLDFADGDSRIFTAEYQRRVRDNSVVSLRGKR